MAGWSPITDLIARFQLRRRASTEAFRSGVRLARTGVVELVDVTADRVRADVRDPEPLRVELGVDNASLVGQCPCTAAVDSVCRHEVAVAHAVWVHLRRHAGRAVGDPPEDVS